MITIPDPTQIRRTTDFKVNYGQPLPAALAYDAMTNPGPVAVSSEGAAASTGQAQLTQAVGSAGNFAYVGYNLKRNVAAGDPISAQRNLIVDGFSGVVAGSPVYVDPTYSADYSSTSSGLTHTVPSDTAASITDEEEVGNVSATSTFDIVVPAGATSLAALDFTVNTNAAASNTNYWTFALTETGNSNAAMLAATAANTTQVTGGNGGFTANVKTAAVLNSTTANLNVTPGDVLTLTITATGSAPALDGLTVRATFSGSVVGARQIGVGWTSTRIFFF